MPLYNIQSGINYTLLVHAGDDPGIVVNRDLVNPVYLGKHPGFNIIAEANVLDPLTFVAFSGQDDVYAVCGPGLTAQVDLMPQMQNWSPSPAQSAASIAALGLMKDTTGGQIITSTGGTTSAVNALPASGLSTNAQLITSTNPLARDSSILPLAKDTSLTPLAKDASLTPLAKDASLTPLAKDASLTPLAKDTSVTGLPSGIAATGVPLLSLATILNTLSTTTLGAGASITRGPYVVSQIGYEIALTLNLAAGATTPFVSVTLQWVDSATGLVVAQDNWYLAGGNAVNGQYVGTGPVAGDRLNLIITNAGSTVLTYGYSIAQNSRTYARDTWYPTSNFAVAGQTVPMWDAMSLILCNSNPSIGFGANQSRLIALWAGIVNFNVTTANSSTSGLLTVNAIAYNAMAASPTPIIYQQTITGGNITVTWGLPRSVCSLTIKNTSASGSDTFAISAIAAESFA